MAALQGAVTVAETHDGAVDVSDHLDFHVPDTVEQLFHEHLRHPEGGRRFRSAAVERVGQLPEVGRDPQTPAASPSDRFHHHPAPGCQCGEEGHCIVEVRGGHSAGYDRHTGIGGQLPSPCLVAEDLERLRRRAHEAEAGLGTGPCEVGSLAQEAVPRVQEGAPMTDRRSDDLGDVEVRGGDRGRTIGRPRRRCVSAVRRARPRR